MSRRVYLLGVGLALVAGAFLLTEALLWRPGVTEANVRRVRPGMTTKQAEAILGVSLDGPVGGRSRPIRILRGNGGEAVLVWDEAGYITDVEFIPERGAPTPGPLGRLRAWLGW
jgi:hypothetical protein